MSTNAGEAYGGARILTQLAGVCIGIIWVNLPTVLTPIALIVAVPSHASRALEVSFYFLISGYIGLSENLKDIVAFLLFRG